MISKGMVLSVAMVKTSRISSPLNSKNSSNGTTINAENVESQGNTANAIDMHTDYTNEKEKSNEDNDKPHGNGFSSQVK